MLKGMVSDSIEIIYLKIYMLISNSVNRIDGVGLTPLIGNCTLVNVIKKCPVAGSFFDWADQDL
jgi:hypothetical protein